MSSLSSKSTERSAVSPDVVTPLILGELPFKGRTLRFRQPLAVHPVFDDELEMLYVEIPELGVMSAGRTQSELLYDIIENVHARWRLYALEEDSRLTEGAQRLKRSLLSLMEDVRVAAS